MGTAIKHPVPDRVKPIDVCQILKNKPVDELARALISFRRITRPHRTATVGLPIIRNNIVIWV